MIYYAIALGVIILVAVVCLIIVKSKKSETTDSSNNTVAENIPSKTDMMNIMILFECLDEIYKTE